MEQKQSSLRLQFCLGVVLVSLAVFAGKYGVKLSMLCTLTQNAHRLGTPYLT